MTTELDALQATLAAEHAAVYVLGLIGSRTSESAEAELYVALRAAYEAHRDSRDTLIGEIAALGETPSPAAAAYTAPRGWTRPTVGTRPRWRWSRPARPRTAPWCGATSGTRRAEAIGLLNDAAVRELSFRGIPEYSPEPTSTRTAEANAWEPLARGSVYACCVLDTTMQPQRCRARGSRFCTSVALQVLAKVVAPPVRGRIAPPAACSCVCSRSGPVLEQVRQLGEPLDDRVRLTD